MHPTDIRPPQLPAGHPEDDGSCEASLDDAMLDLVDCAVQNGWRREKVFIAMANVLRSHRLAYAEASDPSEASALGAKEVPGRPAGTNEQQPIADDDFV